MYIDCDKDVQISILNERFFFSIINCFLSWHFKQTVLSVYVGILKLIHFRAKKNHGGFTWLPAGTGSIV